MLYRITLVSAGLVLALAGCAATGPGASPVGNPTPLAAGWQEHSQPLLHFGPGPRPGTTVWYVPNVLPRGTYEVISRHGDTARLVDGYRFFFAATPGQEVRLILPMGYNSVEAVDARYVASAGPA
ncbi:MAG TPA: hypothetical protein VKI18_06500, partial [Albitalea sp.]|nr:hypothetical protein [Albitalea sp.]